MLGKSLSYNPYLPRVIPQTKDCVFVTPDEVLEKLLKENTHTDCVIVNFKGLYEIGAPSVFNLEVLGLLRRHSEFFDCPSRSFHQPLPAFRIACSRL